jgi:predicted RNase H-like HicB family nuclease
VKFLNDYALLSETAGFSVGYAEVARGAPAVPKAHVQLNRLPHKILKLPLDVLVEPDDQGFLARTPDLPLYGYGEDRIEAIDMLKREIESLFDELIESDHLSEEWLSIKSFLSERIMS